MKTCINCKYFAFCEATMYYAMIKTVCTEYEEKEEFPRDEYPIEDELCFDDDFASAWVREEIKYQRKEKNGK